MIIGTGLPWNSRRNEASRCFISVMSTRRPMMPPSRVRRSSIRMQRPSARLLVTHRRAGAAASRRSASHSSSRPIGLGIVAAGDADPQRILEPHTGLRTGRRCDCRSRHIARSTGCSGRRHRGTRCPPGRIDGLAQPRMGAARLHHRDRRLGLRAHRIGAAGAGIACKASPHVGDDACKQSWPSPPLGRRTQFARRRRHSIPTRSPERVGVPYVGCN